MAKKKKSPGRPAGSTNGAQAIVTVVPAACPKCGSTERQAVRIVRERPMPGLAPGGQPRTHIVWRRVRCTACGQYFIEQEHQNRPDGKFISREMTEEKTIENLDSCSDSELERTERAS